MIRLKQTAKRGAKPSQSYLLTSRCWHRGEYVAACYTHSTLPATPYDTYVDLSRSRGRRFMQRTLWVGDDSYGKPVSDATAHCWG